MIDINNRQTGKPTIKRVGLVSALALVMLILLAACGQASSTGPGAGSDTGQNATATVAATATTAAPEPEATATATEGMDDMGGVTEEVPTATTEAAAPEPDATATTAPDDGAAAGGGAEVQATLREWAIDLSTQEVTAGKITFVVANQGQFAHNFTVIGDSGTIARTPNFSAADGEQTLEVELQPGTYTIICDLPGHAARGQQTQLVVR
jgi:uncharacterized cupredoxin-like copper-binding protein